MDDELREQLDTLLLWEVLEREQPSPLNGWSLHQVERVVGVLLQWLRFAVVGFDYDTTRRWGAAMRQLAQEVLTAGPLHDIMHLEEGRLTALDPVACRLAGEYVSKNRSPRSHARVHLFRNPLAVRD